MVEILQRCFSIPLIFLLCFTVLSCSSTSIITALTDQKKPRTIQETILEGISNLDELIDALNTAMQLEFSTIPPYLCAQWSILPDRDPDDVTYTIRNIFVQEINHLALATNMLTAIGGRPTLDQPSFVPKYPTNGLPGGVWPGLVVDLAPLNFTSLLAFMQIEFPEVASLAISPNSIGAFYDAIAEGFKTVKPSFVGDHQVVIPGLFPITNITDALAAIDTIKTQGEGSNRSPDEDDNELAHYYKFGEIYYGARLNKNGKEWQYNGKKVRLPVVYGFRNMGPTPSFTSLFKAMMSLLQFAWTSDSSKISDAISVMHGLKTEGIRWIKQGYAPQFSD